MKAGRYPGIGAQLWVRCIDPDIGATPEQVRGFLANKELCNYISERSGGMFGDWVNRFLIPDLPPLDLADLTIAEWAIWDSYLRPDKTLE